MMLRRGPARNRHGDLERLRPVWSMDEAPAISDMSSLRMKADTRCSREERVGAYSRTK